MRRLHFDPAFGGRIQPSAGNASAGKHQRMRATRIDNGQFEIAVERRAADRPPHKRKIGPWCAKSLDLDQDRRSERRLRCSIRNCPANASLASRRGRLDRERAAPLRCLSADTLDFGLFSPHRRRHGFRMADDDRGDRLRYRRQPEQRLPSGEPALSESYPASAQPGACAAASMSS